MTPTRLMARDASRVRQVATGVVEDVGQLVVVALAVVPPWDA
jgi:hypothetical protein